MTDVAETARVYIAFAEKVAKDPGFYVPPHLRDPAQIMRELLAENERLRALTEPRPIKEAPMDGTMILGFCGDEWELVYFDGGVWHDSTSDCIDLGWEPVAWVPLPSPARAALAGEKGGK